MEEGIHETPPAQDIPRIEEEGARELEQTMLVDKPQAAKAGPLAGPEPLKQSELPKQPAKPRGPDPEVFQPTEVSRVASTPRRVPNFLNLTKMSPTKSSPTVPPKPKMGSMNKTPAVFRPTLKPGSGSRFPVPGSSRIIEKGGELTP